MKKFWRSYELALLVFYIPHFLLWSAFKPTTLLFLFYSYLTHNPYPVCLSILFQHTKHLSVSFFDLPTLFYFYFALYTHFTLFFISCLHIHLLILILVKLHPFFSTDKKLYSFAITHTSMISTVSAPSTPSLSISCEPTIPCSILSTKLQRPPYTTEPSTKSLSLNHQSREALPTSRLSTRATLVSELPANKPHLAPPHCETDNRESPEAVRGIHCTTRAGGNAVDGTLSLSLRPAGWTRSVLGPSIRRLGAGTGGCVDLYRYTISNKVVAVKTLQTQQTNAPGSNPASPSSFVGMLSRRVLEELGIAVNVKHENIIRTFQVIVESDHKCYVIMEACATDLLTLIQSHSAASNTVTTRSGVEGSFLSDNMVNNYFAQLVRGVQYLHGLGIGHRDLKLDNVCVTEHGVLKIVDFGCATLFRRRQPAQQQAQQNRRSDVCSSLAEGQQYHKHKPAHYRAAPYSVTRPRQTAATVPESVNPDIYHYAETFSSGVCGSDPYMAPEIFQDTNYSAPKVDIWALAIMYFAMCHLQFPWAAAQPSRDPRYANFARNSGAFFDTWFPTKESTWSSRVSFLATQKVNNCNNDGGDGRAQGSTGADTGAVCRVRDIIGRMLDPNPEVRADIEEIAADPWFLSLGAVTIKPAAKNRLEI